jgi:hypothetical protein
MWQFVAVVQVRHEVRHGIHWPSKYVVAVVPAGNIYEYVPDGQLSRHCIL